MLHINITHNTQNRDATYKHNTQNRDATYKHNI